MFHVDESTIRDLQGIANKVLYDTSTKDFISIDIFIDYEDIKLVVKSKLIVSKVVRKWIITKYDLSRGEEHLYELIKAVHWSVWVMIDPKATEHRPVYEKLFR